MSQYFSLRNLRFLLHEVLPTATLTQKAPFQDYDAENIDLLLDAAKQLADQYLFPYYRVMDQDKARYVAGEVKVHPAVRPALEAMAEAGWIAAHDDEKFGGQNMPWSVLNAATFIFHAANGNLSSNAFLTAGAANLIRSFGSVELQEAYIPHLYRGQWQGTMALTEPQAGSSLSDLTTTAEPSADGAYFKIKGQKIYISGGDHNAADNVVHLLLARIKGAPAGTKGISLFVVPKLRREGAALHSNDVTTAGIYGKMGQKGYVAAHLMLGEKEDCRGYLVGEPNQGLRYMFQMMNEARIGTGLMATGTASAAYYASLKYAQERPQGRHPSNKNLATPPVLIIEHADVRRMLLFQKSIVEGSLALLMQCSHYADVVKAGTPEEARAAHLLLELLTPIAKSYPAEMGIQAVSAGMQVLGGAGYTDDFPLEQYYRDIRVNAIYEGTTTIHGIDLLGRKITLENGQALRLLRTAMESCVATASADAALAPFALQLQEALENLQSTTLHLLGVAQKESPEAFLADATLYLEYFSLVVIGWQWLQQALTASQALATLEEASGPNADFYRGKLRTCQYFFEYELPKMQGLNTRLRSSNRLTLDLQPAELS